MTKQIKWRTYVSTMQPKLPRMPDVQIAQR